MRFRPANIRLINRRSNMLRLLLALSSRNNKSNRNDKNNPTVSKGWTGSLHIRDFALNDNREVSIAMKNHRHVEVVGRRESSVDIRMDEWIDNEVVGCGFENVRHVLASKTE